MEDTYMRMEPASVAAALEKVERAVEQSGTEVIALVGQAMSDTLAAVAEALARADRGGDEIIEVGGLRINVDQEELSRAGRPIALHRKEFRALVALARRYGATTTTEQLIDALWDGRPPRTARQTLPTHITRLRRQIDPVSIEAVTGEGYRLEAEETRSRSRSSPQPEHGDREADRDTAALAQATMAVANALRQGRRHPRRAIELLTRALPDVLRLLRRMLLAQWWSGEPEVIRIDNLTIDVRQRTVMLSKRQIKAPGVQFDILVALARRPGRRRTNDELTEAVSEDDATPLPHSRLYAYVYLLRKALGPGWILKAPGGYRFRSAGRPAEAQTEHLDSTRVDQDLADANDASREALGALEHDPEAAIQSVARRLRDSLGAIMAALPEPGDLWSAEVIRTNGLEIAFDGLSPVVRAADGEILPISETACAVASVLARRRNELVTTTELVRAVWGAQPPRDARGMVYTYVGQLRRRHGMDWIETAGQNGYRWNDPDQT